MRAGAWVLMATTLLLDLTWQMAALPSSFPTYYPSNEPTTSYYSPTYGNEPTTSYYSPTYGGTYYPNNYPTYGGTYQPNTPTNTVNKIYLDSKPKIYGDQANEYCGDHVANIGDYNNDGIEDFAFTCSSKSTTASYTGQIYIIYGGSQIAKSLKDNNFFIGNYPGPNYLGAEGVVISGMYNDKLGDSISAAGDFNGDSIDDFIVCSLHANDDYGRCYLFFGQDDSDASSHMNYINLAGNDIETASHYHIIDGPKLNSFNPSYFGFSVAGIGDIDSDGYADVAIGAYGLNDYSGIVYIVHGGNDLGTIDPSSYQSFIALNDSNVVSIYGTLGNRLGYSLSGGEDLNSDGYRDMVVSAVNSSVVFVIYGTYFRQADFTLYPNYIGASYSIIRPIDLDYRPGFGTTVLVIPDFNGDSLSDIVITRPYAGDNSVAAVYVVFGGNIQPYFELYVGYANYVKIIASTSNDNLGTALGNAGDLNGDGLTDILISSSVSGTMAYLVYGYQTNMINNFEIYLGSYSFQATALQYDSFYPIADGDVIISLGNLGGIGDINSDGYNEAIIGHYQYYNGRGVVFVISGNSLYDDDQGNNVPSYSSTHYPTIASIPQSSNCGYLIQNVAGKASSASAVKSSMYTAGEIGSVTLDFDDNVYFYDSFNKSVMKYDVILDDVAALGRFESVVDLSYNFGANELVIVSHDRILKMSSDGAVTNVAGMDYSVAHNCQYASGLQESPATSSCISIRAFYYDSIYDIYYFYDSHGSSLRKVVDGKISKVAGNDEYCVMDNLSIYGDANYYTMPCYISPNCLTTIPTDGGSNVYYISSSRDTVLFNIGSDGIIRNVTAARVSDSYYPCSSLGENIELNGAFVLCQVNSFQYNAADNCIYLSLFSMIYKLDPNTLAGSAVVGLLSNPYAYGFSASGLAFNSTISSTPANYGVVKNVASLTADSQGNLYIADNINFIRKVSNGYFSILIGQLGDGNRTDATLRPLNIPRDFSWSEAQKTLYISDTGSGLILSVDNQGFRNVFAGIELSKQNSVDYFTAKTSLITPIRIAVDHRGVVYFTNTSNGAYFVNQISNPTYPIRRVVGASNTGMDMNFYLKPYYSDGTKIPMYSGMMDIVSYEDYLYFSGSPYMGYPPSSFIGRLHTIDLSVTIIAGGFKCDDPSDRAYYTCSVTGNSAATSAYVRSATCLTVDPVGNIYFYDDGLYVIRKIGGDGIITTIAGIGSGSYTYDSIKCMMDGGCPAISTPVHATSISTDSARNVYFTADYSSIGRSGTQIMKIDSKTNTVILIAGNANAAFYNGNNLVARSANIGYVTGLTHDRVHDVMYFLDATNNIVRRMSCVETSIQFNVTFSLVGVTSNQYQASKDINDFVFKLALIASLEDESVNNLKTSDIEITDTFDVSGIMHRILIGSSGIQIYTSFFIIPSVLGYSTGSSAYSGLSSAILSVFSGGSSSSFAFYLSSNAASYSSVLVSATPSTLVAPVISDYTEISYGKPPVVLHYVSLGTLLGEDPTRRTLVKYTNVFTSTILPIMVIVWLVCFTICMFNSEHKTYQGIFLTIYIC